MKEYKSNHLVTNNRKIGSEPNDFYATEPRAVQDLLNVEKFSNTVWECAVGQGHMANVLKDNGYKVIATDLMDRGI